MAESTPQLTQHITEKVRQLCQDGYQHYDDTDYKAGIRLFYSAWALLPKPQYQWREAGWVLTALGDAYFACGNFNSGVEALSSALHCPEAANNPFIHLRLGQCFYEQSNLAAAKKAFQLTIEQGGEKLFDKEHPKYLNSVGINTA